MNSYILLYIYLTKQTKSVIYSDIYCSDTKSE